MSRACHGHVISALVHQIRLSCAKKTNETSFDIIVVYCCIVLSSFRWFLLVSVDWSLPSQASTCESRCWREPTDRSSESSRTLRISSGCNKDQRHLTFHPENSRHSTHSCNLFGRVKRILSHSIPKNNLTDLTWDTARPPNEALMGENSRHTNLRRTVLRSLQGAWAQHFPNLHIPSRACPAPRLASILQQSLYPTIFWVLLSGSVYSSRTTGKMSRKELQWRPLVTSTFLGQHGSFAGKSLQPLQIAFVRSIFWGMLCACGMHKLCVKALPIENISGVGDGGRMPPMPWMPADLNCNPTHFYHFYLSKRSATISWQFMTTGSARNKQENTTNQWCL